MWKIRLAICSLSSKRPRYFQISAAMPKNKRKDCDFETGVVRDSSGPILEGKAAGIFTIDVLAKPGAKQNAITDVGEESVGIQIAAPPVDGEANKELIKFLSKIFSLRKSDVSLEKGSKSRIKRVSVTSSELNKDKIMQILRSHVDH